MIRPLLAATTCLISLFGNAEAKDRPRASIPSEFHGIWTEVTETGAIACPRNSHGPNSRDDLFVVSSSEVRFIEGGCAPNRFTAGGRASMSCGAEGESWTSDEIWAVKTINGVRHLVITESHNSGHLDQNNKLIRDDHQPEARTTIYQECQDVSTAPQNYKIFLTADETLNFDQTTKSFVLEVVWKFDEDYTKFAIQGINKDGMPPSTSQLAPLAKTNVESMKRFNYFAETSFDGKTILPNTPNNYFMEYRDGHVILHFSLPFPGLTAFKTALIRIKDPSGIVRMDVVNHSATISGADKCRFSTIDIDPTQGCSVLNSVQS